ncbi:hypothetical protein RRG08_038256 [Elysia crispata]|uniref:Uncharacterized protein n=1 Tax=Elysia crispata TaxID=231223 RepID=A0AAE1ANE8_9GAST|nr:hypothetical protein RRG08_038256 [Elysia crispata]
MSETKRECPVYPKPGSSDKMMAVSGPCCRRNAVTATCLPVNIKDSVIPLATSAICHWLAADHCLVASRCGPAWCVPVRVSYWHQAPILSVWVIARRQRRDYWTLSQGERTSQGPALTLLDWGVLVSR